MPRATACVRATKRLSTELATTAAVLRIDKFRIGEESLIIRTERNGITEFAQPTLTSPKVLQTIA